LCAESPVEIIGRNAETIKGLFSLSGGYFNSLFDHAQGLATSAFGQRLSFFKDRKHINGIGNLTNVLFFGCDPNNSVGVQVNGLQTESFRFSVNHIVNFNKELEFDGFLKCGKSSFIFFKL